MKPSTSLLLISVVVLTSFIHAAPISRKNHAVTEPLGFLTNFILNKRARAVNGKVGLQTTTTKRASVIPETPFAAAASIQIHVKAEPENRENKGTKNQVQDDDAKPSIDSTNSRSISTTEASYWNWWQLNNKKSSENSTKADQDGHIDIINLWFHNENISIARRVKGTATVDTTPVEIIEVPIVDETPIDEVQIDVISTVVQDTVTALAGADAASMDESIVSVLTTAATKTINKEVPLKIVASPKHRILYEDSTPNFWVTLQVIEVEIEPEPVHIELVNNAATVGVKMAEIAFAEESSAAVSTAGTGETSIVGAEAVAIAPVTAISATSMAEEIPTKIVTFGSILHKLTSGEYVSQPNAVKDGVAETVELTQVAGGTGITLDKESAAKPKDEWEKDKRGGAGAESDSSEEDD